MAHDRTPFTGPWEDPLSSRSIEVHTRFVSSDLQKNVAYLEKLLGVKESFDIISQPYELRGRKLHIFVINGFYQEQTILQLLAELLSEDSWPEEREGPFLPHLFTHGLTLPGVQVVDTVDELATAVLAGPLGILIDGFKKALVVDTRTYPARIPNVPQTEKVIFGPQDGFVETLLYNTVLIRRRLRDPRLRCEKITVGRHSRTDVAICYLEGVADEGVLQKVRERLARSDIRNVTMAERAVANILSAHPWNPLPTVRFTERADLAAAQIVEGRVVVIVDTAPNAIIVPAPFFTHVPHPEEFHLPALAATYLRWLAILAALASVYLPAIWLLSILEPRLLAWPWPTRPAGGAFLSIPLQLILAAVSIELIRRAVLNTPTPIVAAMSIIGAVVVGDAVIKAKVFLPEVLVVMGLSAVFNFAIPSVEFTFIARLMALFLLFMTWGLHVWGILLGTLLFFLTMLFTRTLGVSYLWPLWPFDARALKAIFLVPPLTADMTSEGGSWRRQT
ncbi:MAG: spore germination protein [Bacillota bacterium]|nr:spore germination protein [Bacillota bacterium]